MKAELSAKELRFGNHFEFMGDLIGRFKKTEIWSLYFAHLAWEEDWILSECIKPIPLTEQWLNDFGFESDGSDYSIRVS